MLKQIILQLQNVEEQTKEEEERYKKIKEKIDENENIIKKANAWNTLKKGIKDMKKTEPSNAKIAQEAIQYTLEYAEREQDKKQNINYGEEDIDL